MLGIPVTPRWRLPVWLLLLLALGGCAVRSQQGGVGSTLPSVKMALFKIPLNGSDAGEEVLVEQAPIERFKAEPVATTGAPTW